MRVNFSHYFVIRNALPPSLPGHNKTQVLPWSLVCKAIGDTPMQWQYLTRPTAAPASWPRRFTLSPLQASRDRACDRSASMLLLHQWFRRIKNGESSQGYMQRITYEDNE
jgi:hypothetical protein